MKKRIVSFLLALVMAVSLLPVQVFAADVDTPAAEPAAVAQEPAKDEEPAQEDPAPVEQSNETDETDTAVYAVDAPAAGFIYSPTADDIKVIGTYQVDENTTWDVRLLTVDSTQYNYVTTANAKTGIITTEKFAIGDSVSGKYTARHYKGSEVYETGKQFYEQLKGQLNLTDDTALDSTATQTCFYNLKYTGRASSAKVSEIYGLLIIQWTAGELVMPDKTALQAAIDAAPKAEDGAYYTANDSYNGKKRDDYGFWKRYQAALNNANSVNANASSRQDAIDAAVTKLQAAIADLIPSSQANTSALNYELNWGDLGSATAGNRYSPKSWRAYKAVRDKAEALMASMFDADGNPTAVNTKGKNDEIETLTKELKAAREKLDITIAPEAASIVRLELEAIRYLAEKYNPDKLSGYTDASLQALRNTRTAATEMADGVVIAEMGQQEHNRLTEAMNDLRKAAYGLETVSQEQITVKVSMLYASDIYWNTPAIRCNTNTYTGTVTLAANTSADTALTSLKPLPSGYNALYFLNGELLYNGFGMTQYSVRSDVFRAVKLHDGDELTVVQIYPKQIPNSSQDGTTYNAPVEDAVDWFRYSTVSAPVEVEAGKPFSITVTSETAMPFHCAAGTSPVAGAKVYRSDAGETPDAVATGYVGVDTYAVTDENGQATLTLYNEGYILLNAFRMDDEGRYTVGASVLVHVKAASDLDAVKKQLRAELDAVYYDENYPETVFTPANWQKVQDAYNAAVAAIDAAETSGAAGDAQLTALQTIKKLQAEADTKNVSNLRNFRKYLGELPDDVTELDASATAKIGQLKTCYEQMSPYQRGQLTGKEQKKYDAIIKAQEAGLAPAKQYKLTFQQDYSKVPAADRAALADMIAYLQNNTMAEDWYKNEPSSGIGGNMQAKLFTFNIRNSGYNYHYSSAYTQITESAALANKQVYVCVNPDYSAYLLCRNAALTSGQKNGPGVISGSDYNWSISDASTTMYVPDAYASNTTKLLGHMTYTVNGTKYVIRSVAVSGADNGYTSETVTFYDCSEYKGKWDIMCNQQIPDTFLMFTMPFSDVTVTVTWAPVTSDTGSTDLTAERTKALSALKDELSKYTIFSKNYAAIKAAYNDGVKAINAAETLEAINNARAKALSNMKMAAGGGYYGAAIPNWGAGDGFDAGQQVGTVTVSVANFTYDDGYYYRKAGETPFLYLENYPLGENDTMMTVILRALKENGYSWTGTGGDDYTLTYLSSISKTENGKTYKLGEFDGGQQSGWMGTLNDWFTNLSFAEFKVANGKLGDGDVISVQYTREGLGEDLSGTFGNSDTTLKALDIEGGKLLTEFASGEAGGTYEYTLAIDSASAVVKLTPTASNKNYLTKIFLNEKVTGNTEGSSFFKRTQSIPVANGDVIYVGCGEYAWPCMNNQSTEARDYTGTWYVLHVVNVNEGAGYVSETIDALPSASDVSYGSYQETAEAAAAARAAYDALSDTAKKNVDPDKLAELEALEKAVAEFQAIDDVKDQIDALPSEGKLTIADRDAVKAAQAAYGALSAEQKEYLTFAQIAKIEALSKRMAEIEKEAVKAVEDLIDDIGTVTKDSKDKIDAARRAYDGLTKEQQDQVGNYQTLVDAEKAYAKLTGGTTPGNPGKKPGGSTTPDKKPVKSGNTGEAGITLYLGMALVAVLAGAVIVTRKRKEN